MKRKLCIGSIVCLVSLIWSGFEAEGQDIEYLLKMGHLKPHQAFFQAPLSPQLSDQTYLFADAEKPPLSGVRIGYEFLGGVAGEYVGVQIYNVGGRIYRKYGDSNLSSSGWVLLARLALLVTGVTFGSSIGVYLVGDTDDETGSFWATWGGSILGIVSGIGLYGLLEDRLADARVPNLILGSVPTIGAIIGFNLTRRYKSSATSTSPAAPPIYFNLVRGRF